jgi:hypothetical protein
MTVDVALNPQHKAHCHLAAGGAGERGCSGAALGVDLGQIVQRKWQGAAVMDGCVGGGQGRMCLGGWGLVGLGFEVSWGGVGGSCCLFYVLNIKLSSQPPPCCYSIPTLQNH